MRGWKGALLEGGVRVPMIIRWPGVSRPGTLNDTPVHLVDLLPTFADAAGADLPEDVALDGMDLRPLLAGKTAERPHPILHYFPIEFAVNGARSAAALRQGDYKLIRFFHEGPDQTDSFELYNLADDVAESRNLFEQMPELTEQMTQALADELERIGARIPEANPVYDPSRGIPPPMARQNSLSLISNTRGWMTFLSAITRLVSRWLLASEKQRLHAPGTLPDVLG